MNTKELPTIKNVKITGQEEYSKLKYNRYCINPEEVTGKLVGGSPTLVNP